MNSEDIRQEVYINDIYRLRTTPFERAPKNIVDIGANVGWFTKLVFDSLRGCSIYSFELDQENFNQIEQNLDIKNYPFLLKKNNVNLFNKAVIGKNKFTSYWKHDTNIGGHKPIYQGSDSYISEERFNFEKDLKKGTLIEEVPDMITLPDILSENNLDFIDFLKLDCEGSEYEILDYAFEKSISRKILNMALEIHGRKTEDYKRMLEKLSLNFDTVIDKGNILYAKNFIK